MVRTDSFLVKKLTERYQRLRGKSIQENSGTEPIFCSYKKMGSVPELSAQSAYQNWNRMPTSISRGDVALVGLPKNGDVMTPLGVPG